MIQHYGFDGQPVTEDEWHRLWEVKHSARRGDPESSPDTDPSRIGSDHVGGLWVSTVWLGLDHSFGEGPPLVFETMVFSDGTSNDLFCARYSTPAEAKEGHDRVVSWLREGRDLDELPF